jgi:hypothetical protein
MGAVHPGPIKRRPLILQTFFGWSFEVATLDHVTHRHPNGWDEADAHAISSNDRRGVSSSQPRHGRGPESRDRRHRLQRRALNHCLRGNAPAAAQWWKLSHTHVEQKIVSLAETALRGRGAAPASGNGAPVLSPGLFLLWARTQ